MLRCVNYRAKGSTVLRDGEYIKFEYFSSSFTLVDVYIMRLDGRAWCVSAGTYGAELSDYCSQSDVRAIMRMVRCQRQSSWSSNNCSRIGDGTKCLRDLIVEFSPYLTELHGAISYTSVDIDADVLLPLSNLFVAYNAGLGADYHYSAGSEFGDFLPTKILPKNAYYELVVTNPAHPSFGKTMYFANVGGLRWGYLFSSHFDLSGASPSSPLIDCLNKVVLCRLSRGVPEGGSISSYALGLNVNPMPVDCAFNCSLASLAMNPTLDLRVNTMDWYLVAMVNTYSRDSCHPTPSYINREGVEVSGIADVYDMCVDWRARLLITSDSTPSATSESTSSTASSSASASTPTDTATDSGLDLELSQYTTDAIYEGIKSYHYHHGTTMNRPKDGIPTGAYRIGIELEVEAKSSDYRDKISSMKSNWIYKERDSSLGSYGVELISIPLMPTDAKSLEVWSGLCDKIAPLANSWKRDSCGLHVHIGKEILGTISAKREENLAKISYLYFDSLKDDTRNIHIFGRSYTYNEQSFKKDVIRTMKEFGTEILTLPSVKKKFNKRLILEGYCSRYLDININNDKTIEFRKGKGSINATRIAAVITYCEAICLYAKSTDDYSKLTADEFFNWLPTQYDCSNPMFRYIPFNSDEQ